MKPCRVSWFLLVSKVSGAQRWTRRETDTQGSGGPNQVSTATTPGQQRKEYNGVIHLYGTPVCPSHKVSISQLSCGISRKNAPFWSVPLRNLRVYRILRLTVRLNNKNVCARKEMYFLCICTTLVLLCVQYNVKLCCLFSSWFAKEDNGPNNNNDCVLQARK